jgi:cholesterol transport system auxiliary component
VRDLRNGLAGAAILPWDAIVPWAAGLMALLSTAAMSGCTGLFHSTARPEQVYYLRAPSGGTPASATADAAAGAGAAASASAAPDATAAAQRPASLRVVHPSASPGLDSPHIMLVQSDRRMNFFAGSRWPAPAPDMIESLIVQTMRASGAWASVEGIASPFPSDYLLQTSVRRFEAEYTGDGSAPPVVHVDLDCLVGRGEGREVIATFSVSASAPAAANRLTEVVAAFEQASDTALEALARQAAQAVREDARRRARSAKALTGPGHPSGPGRPAALQAEREVASSPSRRRWANGAFPAA